RSGQAPAVAPAPKRASRGALLTASAVAAMALIAVAVIGVVHFREQPAAAPVMRFEIPALPQMAPSERAVVSPDGRKLAFRAAGPDGRWMIWLRESDALTVRPLTGTDSAQNGVFWSTDSHSLAFAVDVG